MREEEIRKKLLSNDNAQTQITLNANFSALLNKLIEKDILSVKDLEDMDKKQKEFIKKANNKIVAEIMEREAEYE